jgi:hypothetical protein
MDGAFGLPGFPGPRIGRVRLLFMSRPSAALARSRLSIVPLVVLYALRGLLMRFASLLESLFPAAFDADIELNLPRCCPLLFRCQ